MTETYEITLKANNHPYRNQTWIQCKEAYILWDVKSTPSGTKMGTIPAGFTVLDFCVVSPEEGLKIM